MEDKWKVICEVSRFLRTAPQAVVVAWKAGWTDIKLFPEGYESTDSCGCCTTGHAAGWYGERPEVPGCMAWAWICGPNGESGKGEIPNGSVCDIDDH